MAIIKKVGLAVINDHKVLMVRAAKNPLLYSTLGGKYEVGENDIACLQREVSEEVSASVDIDSLKFLKKFEAKIVDTPDTKIQIKLYFGKLIGDPKPSGEIAEIIYCDSTTNKVHLTPASVLILNWLTENQYIL